MVGVEGAMSGALLRELFKYYPKRRMLVYFLDPQLDSPTRDAIA